MVEEKEEEGKLKSGKMGGGDLGRGNRPRKVADSERGTDGWTDGRKDGRECWGYFYEVSTS